MEIVAKRRKTLGKKTKKLRKERETPSVIFGKGLESIPIAINSNDFIKAYEKAGETSLIDLKLDNEDYKVLISDVQYHPVTDSPLHVSFHKVDLSEKITAEVPVKVVGEDESPILSSGKGLLLTLLNEIEVEALPTDLPSGFEVDVSHLVEIGQDVTVGKLKYDREKVAIVGHEDNDPVVRVDYAEMLEEEEEVEEEALIEDVEATEELSDEEKAAREDTKQKEEETADEKEKAE